MNSFLQAITISVEDAPSGAVCVGSSVGALFYAAGLVIATDFIPSNALMPVVTSVLGVPLALAVGVGVTLLFTRR